MSVIKQYYASKRLSNSYMKDLDFSPSLFKAKWDGTKLDEPDYVNKPYLRIGSGVDCLLTTPMEYGNMFVTMTGKRPSDAIAEIIEKVYVPGELAVKDEDILAAAKMVGYGQSWKPETVVTKVLEQGSEYFDFLQKAAGKIVLSADEEGQILRITQSIKDRPEVYWYLSNVNDDPDLEFMYQLPVYWEYEGVECKCLLDCVIINRREGWVIPVDLKTIGDSVYNFPRAFEHYGYFRQAAFYSKAIKTMFPTYEIKPFVFVVAESDCYSSPLLYECTEKDLELGEWGGTSASTGKWLNGFYPLVKDYKWHTENNVWHTKKEAYLNNYKLELNVFA